MIVIGIGGGATHYPASPDPPGMHALPPSRTIRAVRGTVAIKGIFDN